MNKTLDILKTFGLGLIQFLFALIISGALFSCVVLVLSAMMWCIEGIISLIPGVIMLFVGKALIVVLVCCGVFVMINFIYNEGKRVRKKMENKQ